MHLSFRERPWDLYVVLLYSWSMAGVLLGLGTGDILAIGLLLFSPGYVAVAALFPRDRELGWIERLTLSVGASLALVPLLGLLLTFTPYGIRFVPVATTVTIFTSLVALAAFVRRIRVKPEERLSGSVDLAIPGWESRSALDRALALGVVASVLIAAGALAYVLVVPRAGERFTEFYIQGPGGNATGYPSTLNVSQPASLVIGVVNHEYAPTGYTVRVDLVGVQLVYNATLDANVTYELNRTAMSWFNFTLADGASWTRLYTFSIGTPGSWMVQFLLFKDGNTSSAYRQVRVFVSVP